MPSKPSVPQPDSQPVATFDQLLAADDSQLEWLRTTLTIDFRRLDRLLLRLHYRRRSMLTAEQRNRVLKYLAMGYALSNDVRYLNEFLWFDRDETHPDRRTCLDLFQKNLWDGVHHIFPGATVQAVRTYMKDLATTAIEAVRAPDDLQVALLGAPHRFIGLSKQLRALGFPTKIIFLPGAERRRWRRWVLSSRVVPKLVSWAHGFFGRYTTLTLAPADTKLTELLSRDRYGLAIHRLSLIIRSNLLAPFELGMLNDHFAVLPFVRGRSTIEYSLLFEFPVGATVHFVDEGVDTGDILRFFPYPVDGRTLPTIAAVKRAVSQESDRRFVQVVADLRGGRAHRHRNPPELGLQYFTMHRVLRAHLEQRVLPHRRG